MVAAAGTVVAVSLVAGAVVTVLLAAGVEDTTVVAISLVAIGVGSSVG